MKNLRLKAACATKDLLQQGLVDLVGMSHQIANAIEKSYCNLTIRLCLTVYHVSNRTLDKLFWEAQSEQIGRLPYTGIL